MAQRILGIDIGTYSVKAVRLKSKLGGGFEYLDSYCAPVDFDADDLSGSIVNGIGKIVRDNNLENDTIVTAIPAQNVSGRFLTLPLTDRKKIDQVIDYEIENYIPFSSESVVTDYLLLGKSKDSQRIFAQITKKINISALLSLFEKAGAELKFIDSELVVLYSALKLNFSDIRPHAILDVGHSKTMLTIISNGEIAFTHAIDFGGADINDRISGALSVPLKKADELKRNPDRLSEVDDIIRKSINDLSLMLKRLIYSFEMESKLPLKEIMLTGGTSNIDGIDSALTEKLGIKFSKSKLYDFVSKSAKNNNGADSVIAYGIALRGASVSTLSNIDFKRDKATTVRQTQFIFGALVKAFVMMMILLIFYAADLYIRRESKSAILKEYENDVLVSFTATFPDIAGKGKEIAIIKQKIAEESNKTEKFGSLLSKGITTLDILKELSASISASSKGTGVEVYECSYDEKKVNILGEAMSYNQTDDIKKGLEESKIFGDVKMEYARFTADQEKVKFSMKMSLKEGEE